MAGITLALAQSRLDSWLTADAAVTAGQMIEYAGRRFTAVDAAEIRTHIDFWDRKVKDLTPAAAGGRRRIRYVVPE